MASTLKENINGNYYRNLAVLTGCPERVKVLVEDNLDVPFWLNILSYVKRDKKFDIKPYTYGNDSERLPNLNRGKRHILAEASKFNAYYIGCVDSDYDYLLRTKTTDGQTIENCPYILQTYAYSIENLLCHPDTLNELCCQAVKKQIEFDIPEYIRKVSTIVYPLLIWSLFLKYKDYTDFTASQWDDIFPCDKNIYSSESAEEEILARLQTKVANTIASLETNHSQELDEKMRFESQLIADEISLPFTDCDSYLYVRGHDIHKFITDTVLKPVCQKERKEYYQLIKDAASTKEDIKNRSEQYKNEVADIEMLLNRNYEYKHHCNLFLRISRDVEAIWQEH